MTTRYRKSGEGVSFHQGKYAKADVVEQLGLLNDQRQACLGARDRDGLFMVAERYASRGMVRMAAEVRAEAEEL